MAIQIGCKNSLANKKEIELLKECRSIFADLGGDAVVENSRIQRVCREIDEIIDSPVEYGSVEYKFWD